MLKEMKVFNLSADSQKRISPLQQADIYRLEASRKLDPKKSRELGQYLTPLPVASFMASLFHNTSAHIVLLDPGAGTGTLTAALIEEMSSRPIKPASIQAEIYELEPLMVDYSKSTLANCTYPGVPAGIKISGTVTQTDFIQWSREQIRTQGSLFPVQHPQFTHCIMNPPYKKIGSNSLHRTWLRQIGIETSNLYSAFLALAIKLLSPGGEIVAIVPRSFCNGPYFKPFRQFFLEQMAIRQLHLFDSRSLTFKDDEVLQENIILHAIKGQNQEKVVITSSSGPNFQEMTRRSVTFDQVVKPTDPERFIHIAASDVDQMVINRISVFSHSLADLGIQVSTGPVVDFRLRPDLRQQAEKGTYPLIYPSHFSGNYIQWPKPEGKKPNAIQSSEQSDPWLMTNGWYVLTKRISPKEEKRRIVAALHTPDHVPGEKVGFENHLNVFHQNKAGLAPILAKGLAVYLNSTLLDLYFRQFSGHTQVNATDLRALHYPDLETLIRLGEQVTEANLTQEEVDCLLDSEIEKITKQHLRNPLMIQRYTTDALSILTALKLPRKQLNERSALVLLALIDLKPGDSWSQASTPLLGIKPIMKFMGEHYGKQYAENTREIIRKDTIHQFVDAGIAVSNPDKPDRAVNSPKWCYQITPDTLELIRSFGTDSWNAKLVEYLKHRDTLAEQYAKERDIVMIPLKINDSKELALTAW